MRNRTLIAVGSIVAIILVAVFGLNRTTEAQDTAEVSYTVVDRSTVQSGDLTRDVSATGSISPIQESTLSFQSQAVVLEIYVGEGDRVQQGDVLARVVSRSYDQNLANAEYQLATAQIAYDDLTGDPRDVDLVVAETSVRAAQLSMGPGTAVGGPGSVAAEIEAMEYELALNQNWQAQMRGEDFDPGLDAAWLRLLRLEEGTDEWENARQDYYAAEARETLNEAELRSSQRGVDVARAELDAENNRVRTYAGSSNAWVQLVQAEIDLENLTGDPDAIDLAYAEIDLALAELNLQTVEELGQQAIITAPFDGIITEMNLTQGVLPPVDAIVIINDSQYEIIVPVDELDIARVDVGETVELELDALPGVVLTGTVDNVALTPTLRGDVVTYDVRIALNNTEETVRSGMSGRAWITTETVTGTLFVPSQFIRNVEGLDAPVVVVETTDGTYEVRRVTTGLSNSSDTEILSGLDEGEAIVLLSAADLQQLVQESPQFTNVNQQ